MQIKNFNIKNKLINLYNKDKTIVIASICIGIIITLVLAFQTKAYSETMQQKISQEIIRFHVLANSDSDSDQELKMKVKEEVLEGLASKLEHSSSIDETREILLNNIMYIEDITHDVIEKEGYDYDVSVNIVNTQFPQIAYGNMTLPEGEYEALQIIIGSGKGQNWWCVMYPMLCFVDVAKGEVSEEDKAEMKKNLSTEEYNLIFENAEEVNVKFKSVELWQNRNKSEFHVF